MQKNKKFLTLVLSIIIIIGFIGGSIYIFDPWGSPENYSPNSFSIDGNIIDDFTYLLQYDSFNSQQDAANQLSESKYDLIIMELYYNENIWQSDDIDEISEDEEKKIILCYMSIGEAETYRPYWENDWDANEDGVPDDSAPDWLDIENPDWDGNYKVKFWMDEWQNIIFGSNTSYLDLIIAHNFDGVYLDIVDAFEYYEELGDEEAGQKMVDFVRNISIYAKNYNPSFLIVPQNGESLVEYTEYLDYIDGIGREDILYTGNTHNSQDEIEWVEQFLDNFLETGKFVLEIEYCTFPRYINKCYSYAKEKGRICYVGPRDLASIQINKEYKPD